MFLGRIFKPLVSLKVKVGEQDDESKHVADLKPRPSCWEATGPEHCTGGVGHSEEELDQLQLRKVFLPPQVRPHGWDGGQAVVRIHHNMDKTVQRWTKKGVATGDPVHDKPPDVEHGGVMVDVQKCDLVIVLSKDEEKRVHELDQLREVVPPEGPHHLAVHFWCTEGVLAEEIVMAMPDCRKKLTEHEERQQCEAHIVDQEQTPAGVRLPPPHVQRSQLNNEEVQHSEGEGGEVVVQQQPSSHPWISGTHPALEVTVQFVIERLHSFRRVEYPPCASAVCGSRLALGTVQPCDGSAVKKSGRNARPGSSAPHTGGSSQSRARSR